METNNFKLYSDILDMDLLSSQLNLLKKSDQINPCLVRLIKILEAYSNYNINCFPNRYFIFIG